MDPATEANLIRSLGNIEGRQAAHEDRTGRMEAALGETNAKLDKIISSIAHDRGERSGHRRAAVVISGLVSLLVSGLAVAVSWLAGGTGKP